MRVAYRRIYVIQKLVRVRRRLLNPNGERSWAGGCPYCKNGQNDGFLNVGSQYWAICELHGAKWCLDFHSALDWWKDESQAEWEKNRALLLNYLKIKDYDRS